MAQARLIAVVVVLTALTALAAPRAAGAAQGLEGCLGGGVAPPPEYYLPNLWNGFVVVSDERRDDGQLAATFADPADALSRLHAYCWTGQAERVYARDGLTVDVSVHGFLGSEGATLAQHWFGYQRAKDLGLRRDVKRGPDWRRLWRRPTSRRSTTSPSTGFTTTRSTRSTRGGATSWFGSAFGENRR